MTDPQSPAESVPTFVELISDIGRSISQADSTIDVISFAIGMGVFRKRMLRCRHPRQTEVTTGIDGGRTVSKVRWCTICGAFWKPSPSSAIGPASCDGGEGGTWIHPSWGGM
jgi:hypothetical protein